MSYYTITLNFNCVAGLHDFEECIKCFCPRGIVALSVIRTDYSGACMVTFSVNSAYWSEEDAKKHVKIIMDKAVAKYDDAHANKKTNFFYI